MNRRAFAKRGALTVAGLTLTTSAFKCGSESVSIYVSTITNFLKQISAIMPDRAAFITKIIGVAADFDAAYRRGDFASADNFLNTMIANISTLTNDLGVNLSDQVKMWLAVIGATVQTIAVLLRDQVGAQPVSSTLKARSAKSASAVERLASAAAVDATFQAAKLP